MEAGYESETVGKVWKIIDIRHVTASTYLFLSSVKVIFSQ